jgi:hypothetical protein
MVLPVLIIGSMSTTGWKIGVSLATKLQVRRLPTWKLYERQNEMIESFESIVSSVQKSIVY